MGLVPRSDDLTDRFRGHSRRIQHQEIRREPRWHAESKTFIVGGEADTAVVTTSLLIPPTMVAISPDGETPERKALYCVHGKLAAGTATIEFHLNDVLISGSELDITTAGEFVVVDPLVELAHGDWIGVVVTAASGAAGLSAAFATLTSPE